MPSASPIQENFNSGEFSPLMAGRVTFDRYKSACRVLKNHLPHLQGPVTRRPGFYFCDEVKDSTRATRIVKFKFSTVSAFALEFGHSYVRFKKNRAPVYDLTLTITGITKANPAVVTYTGTDPSNGDHVDITGVVGMTEVNARRYVVTNVNAGANTFELYDVAGNLVNSSAFTAYTSGGSAKRVYTLATTYSESDLFELKFTQSADVLYINHPDYPERQLVRVSDASWTITDTTFLDGPYMKENTTATTLTPAAFTGSNIQVTASAITGINDGTGFQTTDVGRLIRMKQGNAWGYCRIVSRTSTTVVNVDIINSLVSIDAKATWRLGLYSATTGYPACSTFYGDRLYRGGCPEIPERLDGSRVGDYDNFEPSTPTDGSVVDSHAVSFRLNSDDVQTIRWMKGTGNGIAVGTFEGEWLVSPSTLKEAITPTNIHADQSTDWGSADTQPVKAGSSLMFIEAGARRVRELNYLYYENSLQSSDATVLAEHITKGNYDPADPDAGVSTVASSGFVELAYQKKKIPLVWAPREDGMLGACVFSKDDKVLGWMRQELGGYSDSGHTTHPLVESCCVIPASDGSYDELWCVVKRYINGRAVRYNEFLTDIWEQGNDPDDQFFVDCGLTYDGSAATTITGLYHLAGETVQILADGAVHPDKTVSATGTVTLDRSASVVHIGYTYNSDGQTLRPDVGSATGTAQGKFQRSNRMVFRLHESGGLSVGPSFDKLQRLTFRTAGDPTGEAVPLFTGDKDVSWPGNYTTENLVCWRFNKPLAGTMVAIMPSLNTQDR